MNLRVRDVTREGLNFGTEIPVVRAREFRSSRVTLIGVPADSRFRNTLRVYATGLTDLIVTFSNGTLRVERYVTMQHSRDPFDPAYATIGDFPVFAGQAEFGDHYDSIRCRRRSSTRLLRVHRSGHSSP